MLLFAFVLSIGVSRYVRALTRSAIYVAHSQEIAMYQLFIDNNFQKFRRFLFEVAHPDRTPTKNGVVSFKQEEVTEALKFCRNKYREIRAEFHGRGLIVLVDQHSPRVNVPTLDDIWEIHDARRVNERRICMRVAYFSDQGLFNKEQVRRTIEPVHAQLVTLVQQLSQASCEKARLALAEEIWDVDGIFHITLAQLAKWPHVGRNLFDNRDRLRFVSTPQAQIIDRASSIVVEHAAIIDAVTQDDVNPELVNQAVDGHLLSANEFLKNEMKRRTSDDDE